MAYSHTGRNVVLVTDSINHHYRVVLDTYAGALPIEIKTIPLEDGLVDINYLEKRMDEKVDCFVVQSPNLFGLVENMEKIEPINKIMAQMMAITAITIAATASVILTRMPGTISRRKPTMMLATNAVKMTKTSPLFSKKR